MQLRVRHDPLRADECRCLVHRPVAGPRDRVTTVALKFSAVLKFCRGGARATTILGWTTRESSLKLPPGHRRVLPAHLAHRPVPSNVTLLGPM